MTLSSAPPKTPSLWARITNAIHALAKGEGLSTVFDRLKTPPECCPERTVAFTIAIIALGAKMAKADGNVTRHEVTAFRHVFAVPKAEEKHAAYVFNLARQDIAGFDLYAQKIYRMFQGDTKVLSDVLEGLFYISMADGHYHPGEDAFLKKVAQIFNLSDLHFRTIRARHVYEGAPNPYDILGITPATPHDEARRIWKAAVRDCHPDRMIARGMPASAVKLAEHRLKAINHAWDSITQKAPDHGA